jgi:hypothetical protein
MGKNKSYRFVTVPDQDAETFTVSYCTCPTCQATHLANLEWDGFKPKTHLQKSMLGIVKRLEKRYGVRKAQSLKPTTR